MRLFLYLLHVSLITSIFCARTPLKRSSSTRNPDCSPEIDVEPEDTTDINYVFIMDHTLPEENLGKLKYLMKAMSCEITSTEPYKLNILHLDEKQSTLSKHVPSANFTDLLDAAVQKDNSNGKQKSLCHRIEDPVAKMKLNSSSFYRFVIPIDTTIENCSLVDTFRKIFGKHEYRSRIYADVIQFGKTGTATSRPKITVDWSSIDVKVDKLTKSEKFRALSTSALLAEEISQWAHDSVNKTAENNIFDSWPEKTAPLTSITTLSTKISTRTSTVLPKTLKKSTAMPSANTTISRVVQEIPENPSFRTLEKTSLRILEKPLIFNFADDIKPEEKKLEHNDKTYELQKTINGKFKINDDNFTLHESDEVHMDGKTYLVKTFAMNDTVMEVILKTNNSETLTLQLATNQFNPIIDSNVISSLNDLLHYVVLLNSLVEGNDKMLVADMDESEKNGALLLGWREFLIALGIVILLLILLCCFCRYRRKKKTEYYITNPALSPLISTQSSHDEKTSSASKTGHDPLKANHPMIEGTQLSQHSSQSTQMGSQSHHSNPEPYSPPLHFVADIRYDSLRATPPVSLETFASDRAPMKNTEELKSLRINN